MNNETLQMESYTIENFIIYTNESLRILNEKDHLLQALTRRVNLP